ncbi:hypothetical protein LTR53_006496 [Teratosphaeriaceae sp. CCFEE 6253]|nr:hypothetical protein LTR53_006496 [Teratosphaeriaceae sp. CCFEE 6253]
MSRYTTVQISEAIRLAYRDVKPTGDQRGTIVLIHGFPQTSYQFRHIMPLLAAEGYRCVAPDYRGAGKSSLASDFTKRAMADDVVKLLDKLDINEPVHLVGHDIGGMVAFAFARQYPDRLKTVCWGECPLPGTQAYYRARTEHVVDFFHFIFHSIPDLPEALIQGKERAYLTHFYDKISYNMDAFTDADIDHYTAAYSQPGAMRCGLGVYRAFEQDAENNRAVIERDGKVRVPTMILSGEHSRHGQEAEEMGLEVTEQGSLELGVVGGAGHYLAEENPEGFVETLLCFVEKYT